MAQARANEGPAVEPEGILVVDKPAGITSHTAVQRVKKALGARKAGHLGTLDPLASGVLLVCVGPATKTAPFVADHEKEYEATALLGAETDTWDAEGEIVSRSDPSGIDGQAVLDVLGGMKGEMALEAPPYSAIKKNGKPLYKRARRGEKVEAVMRRANVIELEPLGVELPRVKFRCLVSRGTYVRSIVREMGKRLGTGAYLETLRRTRSGGFGVDEALNLDELNEPSRHGQILEKLLNSSNALKYMPELNLSRGEFDKIRNGGTIIRGEYPRKDRSLDEFGKEKLYKALDPKGRLVAIMEIDVREDDCAYFKPVRVWKREQGS